MAGLVVATVGFAVGLESCDGGSDGPETPADVLERGGSIARVAIGADTYDFEVTCYDAGAGSVLAIGTGTVWDPAAQLERRSRVFVQAFLGDPYIGVTVELPGDDEQVAHEEVFEAAIDESFDLLLEDDVIQADDIEFVRNLDLTNGVSESVGTGSVHVTCNDFSKEIPPDFVR
jgi:hypothetical protein